MISSFNSLCALSASAISHGSLKIDILSFFGRLFENYFDLVSSEAAKGLLDQAGGTK